MPYIGTSPSNGVRRVYTYTATASQTTFSGASNEGSTLAYVDNNYLDVYQNGILLGSADYTSTTGTSVVLAQAASVDDIIVIVAYDVFSVADTVSKTDGGIFDGNVTMGGTLSVTGNQTNTGAVTVNGAFTSQGIDDNADATAITIDSSENVGIGTSSLDGKLHVHGSQLGGTAGDDSKLLQLHNPDVSNDTTYRFHNYRFTNGTSHSSSEMRFQRKVDVTEQGYVGLRDAAVTFGYGTTERMRIDNNGKVLVDRTSAYGDGSIGTPAFQAQAVIGSHAGIAVITNGTASVGAIGFVNNNGAIGSITMGGTSTSYNTSSDYRLKKNVDYTFDATTRLKQLKPCRFNFISDADTTVDGFLAHEVSSVVPEAISGDKDATDDDGNIVPQGIDQSKLVPLLVKTIQELEARITALENAE